MEKHYEYIDKNVLTDLIRKDTKKDLSGLLKEIINDFVTKEDLYGLYNLFSGTYEDLYYDIIFKKIKLNKETSKILEVFATPIYQKPLQEQKNLIHKYL